MQYRTLGKSDIQIPTVIVGAWAMGGWCWGGTDEEESVRAIQEAIDLGMNCVDTAASTLTRWRSIAASASAASKRASVISGAPSTTGVTWEVQMPNPNGAGTTLIITSSGARRPVRTASSEQVRQPIYTGAVDQWQNYQPYLTPLVDALGTTLAAEEQATLAN